MLQAERKLRVAALPVDLGMELPDELGDEIGMHEIVLERVEDQFL